MGVNHTQRMAREHREFESENGASPARIRQSPHAETLEPAAELDVRLANVQLDQSPLGQGLCARASSEERQRQTDLAQTQMRRSGSASPTAGRPHQVRPGQPLPWA